MPSTPNGITFPALTDAPNGPAQMQTLALSADHKVIGNFATAAARTAAITAPNVGDLTYRADGAVFEQWNGSAWTFLVAVGGAATQNLIIGPGGPLTTPVAGTATWITVGNVTVPAWATKAYVTWSLYGVLTTTTEPNITMQLKIGTPGGGAVRIMGLAAAVGRFCTTINELITGLSPGSQSVTLFCTWISGANTFTIDTNSRVSAAFTFQP